MSPKSFSSSPFEDFGRVDAIFERRNELKKKSLVWRRARDVESQENPSKSALSKRPQ